MELPKNITQIGEANRSCKIYVEDYVVSYIKQLNQLACNKEMAVALYGTRKTENNVTYIFLYGACKLDFLQRETRHLSQAQYQEIERLRRKYFGEYEFQGYRLLNGEMVEGFHICEQDICRYVPGFAQFYEKNDSMLAYMLEARPAEAAPEVVNQEKYDVVKRRQEERREGHREEPGNERSEYRNEKMIQKQSPSIKKMRFSTATVFGLLCLAGLAFVWDEQGTEDLQVAARQVMTEFSEQKLPDAEVTMGSETVNMEAEVSTLIAEDKLSEAVLAENAVEKHEENGLVNAEAVADTMPHPALEPKSIPEPTLTPESTPTPELTLTPEPTSTPKPTSLPMPTTEPETESAQTATTATASYVVQKGDTLIDICIRQYGTDEMVQAVCKLNGISDSDDIKVGQKILLP